MSTTLPPPLEPSAASSSVNDARRITTNETIFDGVLIDRFRNGDEGAFVEIMERYRPKIMSITFGLLRNHADAEEITQDTFVRAHRGLVNFRGDSSLATWLYRIAVNLSRNRYWYFHRRRRHDCISLDSPLVDGNNATFTELVADVGQDPAQETIATEFSTLVDQCMLKLDTAHREILNLRNVLHQSYEEIAATLGINVGTVKSRIARARDVLQLRLSESFPEFAPESSPRQWFLNSAPTYGRVAIAG
jgi:RNA polymerase sigma-70 factor, ECF subfamily